MCWKEGEMPPVPMKALEWLWGLGVVLGLIAITLIGITIVVFGVVYALRKRMMVNHVDCKAVFITGADKGIGLSVVKMLDRMGLRVYAGCHSQTGADSLKDQVSERVKAIVVEVTDRQSVEKAREIIEAELPHNGLWGLINNAGIARGITFDFAQLNDYREVLEVNFFGSILVTEVFLPLIKESRGRIVNMSSIMGRFSGVMGPYSCSKYALESYTDGLRRSLRPIGVKVSAIEPGFYKTKMTDRKYVEDEIERLWDALPKQVQDDYGPYAKQIALHKFGEYTEHPPLARWNDVEDVAKDVVHALLALFPYTRYVCGLDANVIYRWAAFVPDSLVDLFFPLVGPSTCYVGRRRNSEKRKKRRRANDQVEEPIIENITNASSDPN